MPSQNEARTPSVPAAAASARWVDEFLLPTVSAELDARARAAMRCLQLEPHDEEEAIHLRRLGHACDVAVWRQERVTERHWQRPPILLGAARWPMADGHYDLAWSGEAGLAPLSSEARLACARELHRVCADRGAVLLVAGNRACPLHRARGVAFEDMRALFVAQAGFRAMRPANLAGHFGWSRLPRVLRWLAAPLEAYLRWASQPAHPRRYASALNPMLALSFPR